MLKLLGRPSMTNVAYVCLLLTFAVLGLLVYTLAVGGGLAGVLGAVLVALMTATVVGFRVGMRQRAASNKSGIEIDGANVWAEPLRRDQIDQYLLHYRGVETVDAQRAPLAVAADNTRSAVPHRLAA